MASQKKAPQSDVICIDDSVLALKTMFDTLVDKLEKYKQRCVDAYEKQNYKRLSSEAYNFIFASKQMQTPRLESASKALADYLENDENNIDHKEVKRKLDAFIKEMEAVKTTYLSNKSEFDNYYKNKA